MTYPDDVLKAAIEANALWNEEKGFNSYASEVRKGVWFDEEAVQTACIAIMAERERAKGGR